MRPLFRQTLEELSKDRWFYCACALYAEGVFALTTALGQQHMFVPFAYYPPWIKWMAVAAGFWVAVLGAAALVSPKPVTSLRQRLSFLTAPRFAAGLILNLTLLATQGVFTSAKALLPQLSRFVHDPVLARLDAGLLGQDAWRYLRFLDPLTPLIQGLYTPSWMFIYMCLALAVTMSRRLEPFRKQYLWTMLLSLVLLGNGLALAGMSAGPIFYESVTGDPRFGGLTAHLETVRVGIGSAINGRDYLWRAYTGGASQIAGGISAFPSIHVSMATLYALLARRLHPRLGIAAIGYGGLIYLSSIHLGWHYAVDGLVSVVMTLALWRAVGLTLERKAQPAAQRMEPAAN